MITRLHLFSPSSRQRISVLETKHDISEQESVELALLYNMNVSEHAARIAELEAKANRTRQECRELDLLLNATVSTARRISNVVTFEKRGIVDHYDQTFLCLFYLSVILKKDLFTYAIPIQPITANFLVALNDLCNCFMRYQQIQKARNRLFTAPIEKISSLQQELIVVTLLRYFSWGGAPEYSQDILKALTNYLKQQVYAGQLELDQITADELLECCLAFKWREPINSPMPAQAMR